MPPMVGRRSGCIRWRGAIRQELCDDLTAVHGGAIPNDHHAAGRLSNPALRPPLLLEVPGLAPSGLLLIGR
ncbi:MAG: hypothetical protein ACRERE_21160 [Candidatus Entotheonellia bacterium]